MPTHRFTINSACAFAALAFAATLQAGANRTFVSTAGSDTNAPTNCGPTSPCRTFAVALSATNSGGELVVLASGGYGAFAINQPVTITAIGVDASITATSGDGVDINTTGNVTINGLNLNGAGTAIYGIKVSNVGFLRLSSVTVENFVTTAIVFQPDTATAGLGIYDSYLSNIPEGGGLAMYSGNVYMKNTKLENNFYAVDVFGGNAVIEDSVARANSNFGISVDGGALSLIHDEIVQNPTGLITSAGTTQFAYCNITQNSTAINVIAGTVTPSSPGTSVVSGTVSGSLGTAATLK